MEENTLTVAVTGSNQGIGFSILKHLYGRTDKKYRLIMVSRSSKKGEASIEKIKTAYPESQNELHLVLLDLLNLSSILNFVNEIKTRFNQVDVLVCNAGLRIRATENEELAFPEGHTESDDNHISAELQIWMKQQWLVNYENNAHLIKLAVEKEIVKPKGKIFSTTSGLGKFPFHKDSNPEIYAAFMENYENFNETDLKKWQDVYESEVYHSKTRLNWPWVYKTSKMFMDVWSFWFAHTPKVLEKGIQVYAWCPGFCHTPMNQLDVDNGIKPDKTSDEGAYTALHLIDLPFEVNDEFQGRFWADKEIQALTTTTSVEKKFTD